MNTYSVHFNFYIKLSMIFSLALTNAFIAGLDMSQTELTKQVFHRFTIRRHLGNCRQSTSSCSHARFLHMCLSSLTRSITHLHTHAHTQTHTESQTHTHTSPPLPLSPGPPTLGTSRPYHNNQHMVFRTLKTPQLQWEQQTREGNEGK